MRSVRARRPDSAADTRLESLLDVDNEGGAKQDPSALRSTCPRLTLKQKGPGGCRRIMGHPGPTFPGTASPPGGEEGEAGSLRPHRNPGIGHRLPAASREDAEVGATQPCGDNSHASWAHLSRGGSRGVWPRLRAAVGKYFLQGLCDYAQGPPGGGWELFPSRDSQA